MNRKEALRQEREWEDSYDGIIYNTDIRECSISPGATPPEILIADVLRKLPRHVRTKVQENSTFVPTYGSSYVSAGTAKNLIILAFKGRESDRSKRRTIAHEIGHLIRMLKNPHDSGGYQAEKEADDFSEKYGFGRVYSEERLEMFRHPSF